MLWLKCAKLLINVSVLVRSVAYQHYEYEDLKCYY